MIPEGRLHLKVGPSDKRSRERDLRELMVKIIGKIGKNLENQQPSMVRWRKPRERALTSKEETIETFW